MKIVTFFKFNIILIFLALPIVARAQYYTTGNESTTQKWSIGKLNNIEIIYPKGFDSLAKRYLTVFKQTDKFSTIKTSIVLHPYNVFSNGIVAWAPARVEIFSTPPPENSYPQSWATSLALHESRHLEQIRYFDRGIFRTLKYIFGQQAIIGGTSLFMSKWEMEGDAVLAETELSNTGRGRDGEFLLYYKVAFEKGDYRDFTTWTLGSFNKYEPNEYALGYLILSSLRYKTQNKELFRDLSQSRINEFYNPWSSKRSYKKITGFETKEEITEYATRLYSNNWDIDSVKSKGFIKENKKYSNINAVKVIGMDSVLLMESSLDEPLALYLQVSHLKREKITSLGYTTGKIDYCNDRIYWSEIHASPRWEQKSYSDIVEYNLKDRNWRYLTRKQRFYSPVNLDENKLLAIEYEPSSESKIVVLSKTSGEVLKKIDAPSFKQITEILYDSNQIIASAIDDSGNSLFSYSFIENSWTKVLDLGYRSIKKLSIKNDLLYFESDFDGLPGIFSFDIKNRVFWSLISNYSAFNPAVIGDRLLYTQYTISGHTLQSTPLRELNWQIKDQSKPHRYEIADLFTSQSKSEISEIQNDKFEFSHYSKVKNLFNFHSWLPFYLNISELISGEISFDELPIKPGLTIMTQNYLSTLQGVFGYSYENGENLFHTNLKYTGFLPVIEYELHSSLSNTPQKQQLKLYLPLNYSFGGWNQFLTPQLSVYNTRETLLPTTKISFAYSIYKKMAKKNLYPKWGYLAKLSLMNDNRKLFDLSGFTLSSTLFLPGLLSDQSTKFSVFYSQTSQSTYMPRGFDYKHYENMLNLTFDYALSFYIDNLPFKNTIYFKRFRLQPFIEVARVKNSDSQLISSTGAEFMADVHLLGISVPISTGMRYSYNSYKTSMINFLFNIKL